MDLNEQVEQWLVGMRSKMDASPTNSETPKRPMVTLSYAQTWDGSIAIKKEGALALSSQTSKQMTHALRSWHDGILVGIGTVIADNPRLNVREWGGDDPQPIILDSHLRMPVTSRVCQDNKRKPWVLTTVNPDKDRPDCEPVIIPSDDVGRVDLKVALESIYSRGIRHLMVEGGATVISSFLKAKLADAIVLTVAPMLIGGYKAVDGLLAEDGNYLPRITSLNSYQQNDEIVIWGRLEYEEKVI